MADPRNGDPSEWGTVRITGLEPGATTHVDPHKDMPFGGHSDLGVMFWLLLGKTNWPGIGVFPC